MLFRSPRALALTILAGTALGACDGTGGPVLVPDGGPVDAGPLDGGMRDGGAADETPPTILSTDPDDGAHGVSATSAIAITFSERMSTAGTITATAGGSAIALGAPTWDESGTTVTVTPATALPSEARVRVTVDDDFADVAGNALVLPFTFAFDVGDTQAPTVTGSDPAQGATGLSARLDTITITFSETMDSSVGAPTLSGGPGALDGAMWIDGRTLRIGIDDLAYGTAYELALDGFRDTSGNALDASAYLVDGAIAFTTGGDEDAPRVEDSVPAEGQVNVALRGTPSVVFVFDEPMDTAAGTATLHTIAEPTVLAGTWSEGGRRLTLPIAGRLYSDAAHAVELSGFRDVAGNALDLIEYLGDGRLDFDTGADVTVPVVVFTYPNEGSSESDHRLARIEVAFDRAMDDAAATSVRVDDGVAPFDAALTWNLAGTRAYADVSDRIHTGRSYHVDLRGFVDLAGDPVDPTAPYLGDGVLDFATRRPTGEQCRDELGITEATGRTAGGGYEWVIAETSMAIADNARACEYPDADSSAYSPDAVVRYRKTTGAGSAGGRYLHVTAETAGPTDLSANRVSLAIYQDACGQASPGGPEGRLTCQWDRWRWEQYLDVGAGDYYVWVASTDSSLQDRITVRIEEVDAVPAGESCASPFTADPALPQYTAPTAPGGEHVWTVAGLDYHAVDMDDAWPGSGAIACDEEQAQGTDFVVEFQKASADSLVSVVVERTDTNIDWLHVEALSVCDPRRTDATSYAARCGVRAGTTATQGPRRMTFAAPSGPFYVWGATNQQRSRPLDATIRIQEFPNAPGSSCANAIPIAAAGSTAITPSSLARLDAPSCMRPESSTGDSRQADGITWYRLTSTQAATVVRADAAGTPAGTGAIAVVEAATGRELGCTQDATQIPLLALLPAGGDVCVAVRNTSGLTGLTVAQVPYAGVMGRPTQLEIARPESASGAEVTITGDQWMVATPTTLYMALSTSLLDAPIGGHARLAQRTLTAAEIGNAGVALGEAVFSLDDSSSATTRLRRLVDAAGAPGATAWDTGTSWAADAYDSMTFDGTELLVASDYSTTVPVELRRLSPTVAGASSGPVVIHGSFRNVIGMAADATWIYVAGDLGTIDDAPTDGVYRIRRDQLGTGTPERIATLPFDTTRAPVLVDSTTAAQYLYTRDDDGDVHVIVDPGGAAPQHLGALSTLGGGSDYAMAYSTAGPSIYLFETETVSTGNFVRLD